MSIKNAPPKWHLIADHAKALGASDDMMRKWLARCTIPGAWKVRVFERSGGAISFADMEVTEATEDAA